MKKTGRRKRRAFTPEYKAEVVRLCRESGSSPETIGKDLELSGSLVRTWVRQAEAQGVSDVSASEKEELQRLRQEVKQRPRPSERPAPRPPSRVTQYRTSRQLDADLQVLVVDQRDLRQQ